MDPLAERLARIEITLKSVLPDTVDAGWLRRVAGSDCPDAPGAQLDSFLEPGRALLRRGGKRWRPLVTLLTCEALGGGRKADGLAGLTEIPHNGSLIVDDIEDSSVTRRGGPAIHLEFGTDLAINMGNMMYFLPTIQFESGEFNAATTAALTGDWLTVMRRLHLGQGYDILWHRNPDSFPTRNEYLQMCRFKTGSLASLAARLGARAALSAVSAPHLRGEILSMLEGLGIPAGGEEDLIDQLGRVWDDLGTGFQILDDVRNLTSGLPGKDRGDDIVEGKKSLPVVLHASKAPEDKPKLTGLFARAAAEAPRGDWSAIEETIAILAESGSLEEARGQGLTLLGSGRKQLKSLLPESEARDLLIELAEGFGEFSPAG